MTKTKELTKPSFGEDRKQLEFSGTTGGNIDTLWITSYQYLLKQTYVSIWASNSNPIYTDFQNECL